MFDRVVVPLDGSPLGEAVLPWVRALAARERARVYLVHVLADSDALPLYDGFSLLPAPPPFEPADHGAAGREASRYLAGVADLFGPAANVRALVRTGRPATEIVAAARDCRAELIVMSTHGHTGLTRLVAGGVAEEVVRDAGLPVVLLHPQPAAVRPAHVAAAH